MLEITTPDASILVKRILDAPRELVWKAWTQPEHVVHWWGPNGFTNTIHEMEVKPGGVWRFMMHGPDGTDYPNKIVFKQVEPPSLLTYYHSDDNKGENDIAFEVKVKFEVENDNQTLLTMELNFPSVEERDRVAELSGAIQGAREHTDRLAAYLEKHLR